MPTLNELLDTKVGNSSLDELGKWNDKPGTFGHFLLNQAQDMNYLRTTLDKLVRKLEDLS